MTHQDITHALLMIRGQMNGLEITVQELQTAYEALPDDHPTRNRIRDEWAACLELHGEFAELLRLAGH